MGASPELLLTAKAGAGHAETRALAGTRKRSEGGEWSAKNLAEHRMVTDDMCRRIEELTLEPRLGQQYNFAYGNIEHLCTPIETKRRPRWRVIAQAHQSHTPDACCRGLSSREGAFRY